jgi:hypothetical protein
VMIAHRNLATTGMELRLGNGEQLDHWRQPTFNSPWTNSGSGPILQYRMLESGNSMQIVGDMSVNGAANGSIVANFPAPYRPNSTVTIAGGNSGVTGNLVFAFDAGGDLRAFCNAGFFTRIQINDTVPLDTI